MSSRGIVAIASAIVVGLAGAASAATVLLDFGSNASFRGASVVNPDANGNRWNSVTSGAFFGNLVNSTGAATTADFFFDSGVGIDSYNGPAGVTFSSPLSQAEIDAADIDAAALGILGVKAAAVDYATLDNGNLRLVLADLDATRLYNLSIFGSHKFNVNNTTRYTVFSDAAYTIPVRTADLLVGVNNDHNRSNLATLNGLVPGENNALYIQVNGAGGTGAGYINALSLTDVGVPEPTSIALLSLAGVSLLRRR